MARVPAVAYRPITVTDVSSGKQLSLPVSSLFFEDGKLKAEGAIYTANKKLFDDFLAHLSVTKGVVEGPPAATRPALVIRAKRPGGMGNFVRATFKDFDAGPDPKFNAEVAEADTYTLLTPDSVQKTLGSNATNGTQPGLVFVPGAAPAANAIPKAGSYPLKLSGNPGASVDIPLNAGGGNAFKVQAAADGADGELTTVDIKDVDTVKSTFTLIASWKKTSAAKIAAADLAATFAYEIEVTPPDGAAKVGTPQAGVVTLVGGADAAAARKASAAVVG